jgi:hypothetical protein
MPAESLTTIVTTFTDGLILSCGRRSTIPVRIKSVVRTRTRAEGAVMKLKMISSAVVVYTALAVACICYAGM